MFKRHYVEVLLSKEKLFSNTICEGRRITRRLVITYRIYNISLSAKHCHIHF